MSTLSSRLGLYLPAGNENVSRVNDIINNFEKLEDLVGLTLATSSVAPSSPFQGQFRLNTDNHRTYMYDRTAWQEFPTASERCGSTIGWGTAGDANNKIQLTAAGRLEMGAGGASAVDVNLYRNAANVLKTDDDLIVAGAASVTGALAVSGGTTGIVDTYNANATATLTLGTSAADITGASVTVVTSRANVTCLVVGTVDVSCTAWTTNNVAILQLSVGGSTRSEQGLLGILSNNARQTISRQWIVTIPTAGSTVFKLQGQKNNSANTVAMQLTHSGLSVVAINPGT